MNFGETQTFGPIQYRLWKVGTIRPTLFILHCRVWQRNQWGWFAIKVNDDRNLADGDVEMKEWFRIRFGGRTDENCQWGKERMTARFLTWTVSWRVVPFSETWKLRLKWEVGKGVGWEGVTALKRHIWLNFVFQKQKQGTSLAVQWLGFRLPMWGRAGRVGAGGGRWNLYRLLLLLFYLCLG